MGPSFGTFTERPAESCSSGRSGGCCQPATARLARCPGGGAWEPLSPVRPAHERRQCRRPGQGARLRQPGRHAGHPALPNPACRAPGFAKRVRAHPKPRVNSKKNRFFEMTGIDFSKIFLMCVRPKSVFFKKKSGFPQKESFFFFNDAFSKKNDVCRLPVFGPKMLILELKMMDFRILGFFDFGPIS